MKKNCYLVSLILVFVFLFTATGVSLSQPCKLMEIL